MEFLQHFVDKNSDYYKNNEKEIKTYIRTHKEALIPVINDDIHILDKDSATRKIISRAALPPLLSLIARHNAKLVKFLIHEFEQWINPNVNNSYVLPIQIAMLHEQYESAVLIASHPKFEIAKMLRSPQGHLVSMAIAYWEECTEKICAIADPIDKEACLVIKESIKFTQMSNSFVEYIEDPVNVRAKLWQKHRHIVPPLPLFATRVFCLCLLLENKFLQVCC